jgi:hypothetical protein
MFSANLRKDLLYFMTVEKAGICSPCQQGRVTTPLYCQLRIVFGCRFLGATKRTVKLFCDLALQQRIHINGKLGISCFELLFCHADSPLNVSLLPFRFSDGGPLLDASTRRSARCTTLLELPRSSAC